MKKAKSFIKIIFFMLTIASNTVGFAESETEIVDEQSFFKRSSNINPFDPAQGDWVVRRESLHGLKQAFVTSQQNILKGEALSTNVVVPYSDNSEETSSGTIIPLYSSGKEDFEGSFPGSYWFVGDNNPDDGYVYWADVSCKSHLGSWSGWCADIGGPADCTEYSDNMDAYMYVECDYYGTTSGGTNKLYYDRWVQVEDGWDYFHYKIQGYVGNPGHGVDGIPDAEFTFTLDGDSADWEDLVITLGSSFDSCWYLRITFYFHSDGTVHSDEGAYLDEIEFNNRSDTAIYPISGGFPATFSPPQLVASGCYVNPTTTTRGGRLTVYYLIENSNSYDVTVDLGCSIRENGTSTWISDPDDDVYRSCPTGESTQYRYFDIPSDAAFGNYDVAWGLWETIGSGDPWDMLEKTNQFTVTQQDADLALLSMAVSRPADSTLRTFTACSFDIRNNGPTALSSEGMMVDYYLSDDIAFGDADDKKIGDTGFSLSLVSGATTHIDLTGTGLSNMYRFWVEGLVPNGNYYVFAKVRITDGSPVDSTPNNDLDRTDSTFPYTGTINLMDAVDASGFSSITTGTSAKWFGQTTTYYYDGDAAQSADIDDSGESYMYITVTGPGTIHFYWKVSSEADFDYLQFYNDSTVLEQISGTVDWISKQFSIGSGSHTLKWRYMKDGSVSSGSDCGWLDYVRWIATPLGEIHGSKWNDLDGDATWDGGEQGLSDWKIYIDENGNGQWDSGEPYDWTGADGSYSFVGLASGPYVIAEELQVGWVQTYPAPGVAGLEELTRLVSQITTTNSTVPIFTYGEVVEPEPNQILPLTAQSGPLINMDDFRADPRFSGIDGSGYSVVILDTGIDLDHPYFGPDNDNDGVADRIVFQYDFADGNDDASDHDNHGSNVSSIVGSQDSTNTGMAPGVDIIPLKVFTDGGAGNFGYVEQALQWVVNNAAAYNVVSVNMSLGDNQNWTAAGSYYGLGDELAALEAMGVIVVSASGNEFFTFSSQQGVAYPSADPSSLSIGAVYDAATGGWTYNSGAIAYSSGADRITPFSQRHATLTTVLAPGAVITGANQSGGTVDMHGTSQASPHIAGIAVLAQQLAENTLGRRLTTQEYSDLLRNTAVTINDGDDEDDNVTNTGLNFPRVDMLALAEGILVMGAPGTHTVVLNPGEVVSNINFGNRVICTPPQITDQPDSQTVCVSQEAVFNVVATGTEPLHYQWKKDGVDVGSDSSTLTLYGVQLSDDGSQITCDVSNTCGVVITNSATLTVNTAPVITQDPSPPSMEICDGQSHEYCVTATGTSPLSYQWQRNGGDIPGATSSCYSATQSGSYRCVVSNSCDSATSNTATLTVNSVPVITDQPDSQTVCEGGSVQFCVTATGASSYQWQKNGSDISGATSSCHTINPVTTADAGNYTCVVSNNCGSVESSVATLTVTTAPVITQHPQNVTVFEGQDAVFTVEATGTSPLHYQWKKGGGNVGTDSSTLTLSSVQLSDDGSQITCDVSNTCGAVTTNTATLTVNPLQYTINASAGPNGTIDPNGDIIKNPGEDQQFIATPDPNYMVDQWYLDGNSVQTGDATYTLYDIQSHHLVYVTFRLPITIYVDANSPNDPGAGEVNDPFRRIQDAIDTATGGDEVHVAGGEYLEAITMKDGVNIYGGYDGNDWNASRDCNANETVIDGQSGNSVVSIIDANVTVDGFTIQNGDGYQYQYGGGIYCASSNETAFTVRILNNIIQNNTLSRGYGAGIYCDSYVQPVIVGNIIRNNTIYEMHLSTAGGGGIYCAGADCEITDNTVVDNLIVSSSGEGYFDHAEGGGIWVGGGLISNNTVSRNSVQATGHWSGQHYVKGGGIYCDGPSTVTRNLVEDNELLCQGAETSTGDSSEAYGGGIYALNSEITQNIVKNNICHGKGCCFFCPFTPVSDGADGIAYGGGIYALGAVLNNNVIAQNQAIGEGGEGGYSPGTKGGDGIAKGGGIYALGAILTNNTIADNNTIATGRPGSLDGASISEGAGIYSDNSTMISNTIIWGNSPDQLIGQDCNNVTYCDISDGTCGGQNGNISANPLFVDPNSGDYHLPNGSPCIDAGDNNAAVVFSGITSAIGTTTTIIVADANDYFIDDEIEYDNDGIMRTVVDVNALTGTITFDQALGSASELGKNINNYGQGDIDGDDRILFGQVDIGADEFPGTFLILSQSYNASGTAYHDGCGDSNSYSYTENYPISGQAQATCDSSTVTVQSSALSTFSHSSFSCSVEQISNWYPGPGWGSDASASLNIQFTIAVPSQLRVYADGAYCYYSTMNALLKDITAGLNYDLLLKTYDYSYGGYIKQVGNLLLPIAPGHTYEISMDVSDTEGESGDVAFTFEILPLDSDREPIVHYVDITSPNEPGTGTWVDPYRSVQNAIYSPHVIDGDTVVVMPETYYENLFFGGKGITLIGASLYDPNIIGASIIDGSVPSDPDFGSVVEFLRTEDGNSILKGLTLTGGTGKDVELFGDTYGGGIFGNGASPTIENCLIADNSVSYGGGSAVYNSNGLLKNCTIANNTGYAALYNCGGQMRNCIIWGNEYFDLSYNSIIPTYSCIQGFGTPDEFGNFEADPLFNDSPNGDFHLFNDSPCIDSGDPNNEFGNEPLPNGERINTGAYGNTAEAAISFIYFTDSDGDGILDYMELEWGLNPDSNDTDGDGLTDGYEACYDYDCNDYSPYPGGGDLNADSNDTDSDGMPDGWEDSYELDPLLNDANDDLDGDGYTNLEEFDRGSSPNDANSVPECRAFYVDDDALNDPGSGTELDPFRHIQDGINAAIDGDTVIVAEGTYEKINFDSKNVVLTSIEPNDPNVVANTIIDGNSNGSVVTFVGTEDPNCLLTGFTITNGATDYDGGGINGNGTAASIINCRIIGNIAGKDYGFGSGGGIYNVDGEISNCDISFNSIAWQGFGGGGLANCDGPITNCRITHNSSYWCYGWGGGGLRGCNGPITNCVIAFNSDNGGGVGGKGGGLSQCDGQISNCLIYGNRAYTSYWMLPETSNFGGGLYHCDGDIVNCTIANNVADNNGLGGFGGGMANCDGAIYNCIVWGNVGPNEPQLYACADPNYSCIQGWTGSLGGVGNMGSDPCFADPCNGDYHLKSYYGRWDPSCQSWIYDDVNSPCIDAGDPNDANWMNELWPHGKRINIGAYGGISEASMSPSVCGNIADLDHDGDVDYTDLMLFAEKWPNQENLLPEDFDLSGNVDFNDYAIFGDNWLWSEDVNLVGYWRFDENNGDYAWDSSCFENHGTLVNSPVRTDSGELLFDGVDDYVEVNDSDSLQMANQITVSVWVYLNEYSTDDFPKVVAKPYQDFSTPWEL